MTPVDPSKVRAACHAIANRASGTDAWNKARHDLADEIGLDLPVLLEDAGVKLVTAADWRRLAALDDALAALDR
jgi:hypothetical protein